MRTGGENSDPLFWSVWGPLKTFSETPYALLPRFVHITRTPLPPVLYWVPCLVLGPLSFSQDAGLSLMGHGRCCKNKVSPVASVMPCGTTAGCVLIDSFPQYKCFSYPFSPHHTHNALHLIHASLLRLPDCVVAIQYLNLSSRTNKSYSLRSLVYRLLFRRQHTQPQLRRSSHSHSTITTTEHTLGKHLTDERTQHDLTTAILSKGKGSPAST